MCKFERILVPLDGSPLAEKALPLAILLAQKFESELLLMRATDFLHPTLIAPHLSMTTAKSLTAAHEQSTHEAYAYLQEKQEELSQKDVDAEILLLDTLPAEGIIDAAITKHADCIVMFTHGRSGIARWALGSVADKVVHHAPCPVLLVRHEVEEETKDTARMVDELMFVPE